MTQFEKTVTRPDVLAESSLPKLGVFSALGAALLTSACASTRPPNGAMMPPAPLLTAGEVEVRQADQQARVEFTQAQAVARSLGITNFVYVASNSRDYASFSKVESLSGDTNKFLKSAVRIHEKGEALEFTVEGFQQWQARQVATVCQRRLQGSIIDLDGRVYSVAKPGAPVSIVEPFLVLRSPR